MPTRPLTRAQRRLRELRWFRALPNTWREHAQAYCDLASALEHPASARPGPPLTVVLPVFTRPENLALSVSLALRTPGVTEVRVCLNDPAMRAEDLLDENDQRIVVDLARVRRGPVERYRAAARGTGSHSVSPDDDLFLHPRQLRGLADRALGEPRCAHGIYGQLFDTGAQRYTQNLCRRDGTVHVLNRAYAFSRDHLVRYLALLDSLDVPTDAARIAIDDDIVLSFAAEGLPQVHDLGPWIDCPSETDPRVSRFGRRDAARRRCALFNDLARRAGLPDALGPFAEQPRWSWAPRTAAGASLFYASGLPLARALWRTLPFHSSHA